MRAFVFVVILLAALALAAFCAGAETGFLSLSRGRVLHMARAGSRKAKRLQNAILDIKHKLGKNAILKGMNLLEGATAKERNEQVGGHKE